MSTQTYISQAEFIARFERARIAQLTGDPRGEDIGDKAQDAINEFANSINASLRSVVDDIEKVDISDPYLKDLNGRGAFLIMLRDKRGGWSDDHYEQWKEINKELDKIASGKKSVMLTEGSTAYGGYFKTNKRVFGRTSYGVPGL